MTEPTLPTATEAPAVAGRIDQPVRPVSWRREWNGDVSDLGAYVHADSEDELDHDGPWEPLYDQATLDAAVAAERERWRTAAEYAAHQLEKARIWGGMEWHYNPLHPMHYRSALGRLRDVLRA